MKNAKVTIALTNPKSPSNVGAVMRAAGCYQVDQVCYTGQRYARAAKFNTDTQDVSQRIPLVEVSSVIEPSNTQAKIICVELVEGAIPLPEFQHPQQAVYVFGPEDGTIGQDIVDSADAVVYIPTVGCMNLAATVNVVLYDRLAKSSLNAGGDALIRRSRDTNNRVKVKAPKRSQPV